MKHAGILAGLGLALLVQAAGAAAQTYPVRPLRIVVPFVPGGATDIVSRALGQRLSEALGRHGLSLEPGDVVLTGAIVPAQHLNPGQMAELASDGLGDIRLWVD